jgi:putative PIN family toxin of toxin-antitoxin system
MEKTKTFVLDTNTLVSAFLLSPSSIPAQAYYKAQAEGKIVLSDETFAEFNHVFIRPKFDRYLSLIKRMMIIEDLRDVMELTPVNHIIKASRDPKDDKYLELAVSANVACIITGDKDLLVLHPFQNIPILSAADFIKNF